MSFGKDVHDAINKFEDEHGKMPTIIASGVHYDVVSASESSITVEKKGHHPGELILNTNAHAGISILVPDED